MIYALQRLAILSVPKNEIMKGIGRGARIRQQLTDTGWFPMYKERSLQICVRTRIISKVSNELISLRRSDRI